MLHLVLVDNGLKIKIKLSPCEVFLKCIDVIYKHIFVQEYELPWVQISVLKVIYHLMKLKFFCQPDPTYI